MRLLFTGLLVLFLLIQYPLWMGRGGWFEVMDMRDEIAQQRLTNDGLRARNEAMQAEVEDLRTGTEAAEERARADLGLMHRSEVFVQILPNDNGAQTPARP
ncbi:cell division protein FtsB [Orrella marina]|uniref:Cell division protein FtsB n=1 Tax=Orrella marina TaxID=2163011 RepID=A0A2R4XIV6_9BURK|nr:cell division protein FtsB [Orrella marina]AWB33752.1 cell division protein FtsB [Orrella marina]